MGSETRGNMGARCDIVSPYSPILSPNDGKASVHEAFHFMSGVNECRKA